MARERQRKIGERRARVRNLLYRQTPLQLFRRHSPQVCKVHIYIFDISTSWYVWNAELLAAFSPLDCFTASKPDELRRVILKLWRATSPEKLLRAPAVFQLRAILLSMNKWAIWIRCPMTLWIPSGRRSKRSPFHFRTFKTFCQTTCNVPSTFFFLQKLFLVFFCVLKFIGIIYSDAFFSLIE